MCVCVWREAGALVLSFSLSPSDIKHGFGGLALHLLHSHTHARAYTCAHVSGTETHERTHKCTRLDKLHINTLSPSVSLTLALIHSRRQTHACTHTEREWNPPEGSFGTALMNLSPAGKQSVGSERKPVGASSRSPLLLFLSFSCTFPCSLLCPRSRSPSLFFFSPRLIVAPSSPAQSPSHHSYHYNPPLCTTAHLSLLSAAAQRTAPADFIHGFINLSSFGVLPLASPVLRPSLALSSCVRQPVFSLSPASPSHFLAPSALC